MPHLSFYSQNAIRKEAAGNPALKHMKAKKNGIYAIFLLFFLFLFSSCIGGRIWQPVIAYAAENNTGHKAYLYFYTVDGEEIEALDKRVSQKKGYTFKNPDSYKYLPVEDGEKLVYPDLYYQVKGTHWDEKDEDGNVIKSYREGEAFEWAAGNHYFYVKTDNPNLTGENIMDLSRDEQAHLYFCNIDGSEIYSLQQDLSTKDDFTFPSPADYSYWFEGGEGEDGRLIESDEYSGKGVYWYCMDDNEKEYLFKGGDTCKFKAGEYFFYPRTDDPVRVTFYYPFDYDRDYVTDDCPGSVYATIETKVGEDIRLKKSLGALIWESTFQGWEEMNYGDGEIFPAGSIYSIMNNGNLDFYATYEYDEDWNPDAVDENKTADELEQEKKEDRDFIVDIDKINAAAGAGYGAYVDSSGKLQKASGKIRINGEVNLYGIPGTIKKDSTLTPMKPGIDTNDPDNYKNPENYAKDKYGNNMEDSKLEAEINNVLRQDDSAMYMDVYGNAFVYYSQLSREDNMQLALERLTEGKTGSWVKNVQNWDTEVINRFEAIEFALLYGAYPKDGQELVNGITWKNSYMSQKAFEQLVNYKKIWSGWLDSYDDGLYEKYKKHGGGDSITIGKNLFSITAYAETKSEKNSSGKVNQIGSRFNVSNDIDNVKFKPQYYDPTKIYSYSSYSFSSLASELNGEQMNVLQQIFNSLVSYGFTEEAAAGACGNIWQECTFNPKIQGGIVQWMQGRQAALKKYAGSGNWQDLSIQLGFMEKELNEGYLNTVNGFLGRIAKGETMSTTKNINAATDAWCAGMEGCVCYNSKGELNAGHSEYHNVACGMILGHSYQHLETRRKYAKKVYAAMTRQGSYIGGDFAGMDNAEIMHTLFPKLQGSYSMLGTYYSESEMNSLVVKTPVAGTGKYIYVHQAIADNVKSVFEELHQMGFNITEVGGFIYRGIARNGTYLSVKNHASFHASGLAIDINWSHSPQFSGTPGIEKIRQSYKPASDPLAVNVAVYNVFKEHGLLWGRDFSTYYDLMHFSLGEVSQDGRNAWISNGTEGIQ